MVELYLLKGEYGPGISFCFSLDFIFNLEWYTFPVVGVLNDLLYGFVNIVDSQGFIFFNILSL